MKTKTEVVSSQIKSLEYDTETNTLIVTFNQGKQYEYSDVSAEEFRKLVEAESIGRHFNLYFKGVYPYKQI
jgi:hypothetical protein